MRYIGIDSGSTTTKLVVMEKKKVIHTEIVPTSYNPKETMRSLYDRYSEGKPSFLVTTGYGRKLLEQADFMVTEISCHAKGAHYLGSNVKTVIDVGGQDSKVMTLSETGTVKDFLMNDKCAAGTGRFIEVMMRILQKDLLDLDTFIEKEEGIKINSMCAVFAESEVIGLLANGVSAARVARGVIDSVCQRTAGFAKRLPIEGPVFFSGGLAQSDMIREALKKELNLDIQNHPYSQFAGAIGAALIGEEKNNA